MSTSGGSQALPAVVRWKRLEIAALERVSRPLAERVVVDLFKSTRRVPPPDAEGALLSSGKRLRVRGLTAWRWGTGAPVFLMHGWEGRGAQLGAFVEPLVQRGFSVVLFDARGHGASPGSRATLADFSDGLTALARSFGQPRAVIAHSFGALATLLAVKRGLRPATVVLIAPPSPRERLAWFESTFGLSPQVVDGLKQRARDEIGEAWEDVEGAALAKHVEIPGLLVHDDGDKETPLRVSEDIARAWAGATLHVTHGLGHRRILKDRAVVRQISDFVAARAALPESPLLEEHLR